MGGRIVITDIENYIHRVLLNINVGLPRFVLTVFLFQMSSSSTTAMCNFRSKGEGDEKDEKVEVPQPELLAQNYSLCWRDRDASSRKYLLQEVVLHVLEVLIKLKG